MLLLQPNFNDVTPRQVFCSRSIKKCSGVRATQQQQSAGTVIVVVVVACLWPLCGSLARDSNLAQIYGVCDLPFVLRLYFPPHNTYILSPSFVKLAVSLWQFEMLMLLVILEDAYAEPAYHDVVARRSVTEILKYLLLFLFYLLFLHQLLLLFLLSSRRPFCWWFCRQILVCFLQCFVPFL